MARTIQVRVENDPYAAMGEQELLAKLKRSRGHCEEGRCREADKVISDLKRLAQGLSSYAVSRNR